MKQILSILGLAIVASPALADVNPPMPQPPERLPEALAIMALLAITAFGMLRRKRQG